jgi:hypothetical protein
MKQFIYYIIVGLLLGLQGCRADNDTISYSLHVIIWNLTEKTLLVEYNPETIVWLWEITTKADVPSGHKKVIIVESESYMGSVTITYDNISRSYSVGDRALLIIAPDEFR